MAALLVATIGTRALAIDTTLAPGTIDRAIAQGRGFASEHRGFVVAPYLLFGVADAVQIQDGEGVEAVELATPYEALRYRAFLSGFERSPMTPPMIAAFVVEARTHVDFVVYVHSRSEIASSSRRSGPARSRVRTAQTSRRRCSEARRFATCT